MAMNPIVPLAALAAAFFALKKKKTSTPDVIIDDIPDDIPDDADDIPVPGPTPAPEPQPKPPEPSPEPIIEDKESLDYSGPLNGGTGNPPNLSGNSKGYNTGLFPTSLQVRMMFNAMGYGMKTTPEYFNVAPPATEVRQFQREYNLVSSWAHGVKGRVAEEGVAGKNTLNALEAALKLSKIGWMQLLSQAKVLEQTYKNTH